MWTLFLVGLKQSEYSSKEEAVREFKDIPHNYGNLYLKGPNGETVNIWDVRD